MADMLEPLQMKRPELESLDAFQRHLKSEVMPKKFLCWMTFGRRRRRSGIKTIGRMFLPLWLLEAWEAFKIHKKKNSLNKDIMPTGNPILCRQIPFFARGNEVGAEKAYQNASMCRDVAATGVDDDIRPITLLEEPIPYILSRFRYYAITSETRHSSAGAPTSIQPQKTWCLW
ncbi:hypothetical protein IEQ34_019367 [Dendrobium chrysotoxum]|uniref:Uncharacterized protein n=1 Tax=Dendrobium chrysotoxum TaxID=161865 RepID=A0AAV7G8G4_DENCH|nr:hypothetical protein IEQ34_019367 [Dendrobium chrysotoxum]